MTKKLNDNLDNLLSEVSDYIQSTNGAHYGSEGTQTLDVLMETDHGVGFCVGNVMKYPRRYGEKDGYNRKDLLKMLHYGLVLLAHHPATATMEFNKKWEATPDDEDGLYIHLRNQSKGIGVLSDGKPLDTDQQKAIADFRADVDNAGRINDDPFADMTPEFQLALLTTLDALSLAGNIVGTVEQLGTIQRLRNMLERSLYG